MEYIGLRSFRDSLIKKIIIPPNVKEISDDAFILSKHLEIVDASNSNLKTIKKSVFISTSLKSLSLPSCVEHFDNEWCSGTENLINFTIAESNVKNISNYNDIFILGKSDLSKDVFDVLFFARRDVKKSNYSIIYKAYCIICFSELK